MKTHMLQYDLPEEKKIPNPSSKLRRVGFRSSQSCWIIRSDDVPWARLNEMREMGAIVDCFPIEIDEENLVKMAVRCLTEEVKKLEKSLQRSITKADTKLASDVEGESALTAYTIRVNSALKRARKALEDAEAVAKTFGVDLSVSSPESCMRSLRANCEAKAVSYTEALASIQNQMATDGVPSYVLADMLEEEGKDSEQLREVFQNA